MSCLKYSENVGFRIGYIPRECYPRYDYTAKYVTRLTRKCNKLITTCNLIPLCDLIDFETVQMFIQTRTNMPILSDNELVYRPIPEGKTIDWNDCDYGYTYNNKSTPKENSIHPVVLAYSSNDVKAKEFFGISDIVIFISDQKSGFSLDSSIEYKCVSKDDEFAKILCLLLERFTLAKLRHTFEVVQVLSAETTDGNLRMLHSFDESDVLNNPAVKKYMSALINHYDRKNEVHLTLTSETPLADKKLLKAFLQLLRQSEKGTYKYYLR